MPNIMSGDGGTSFGTSANAKGLDQGDTRVDEKTLRKIHLSPYPLTIEAGVASIMPLLQQLERG